MGYIVLLVALLLTGPAMAQDYYSGVSYEKLNFKYDRRLDRSVDGVAFFYGIENEHRGLEIGTFTTANATKETDTKTSVRLQGLTLDGYMYSPEYHDFKAFLTTGTVIMDVTIDGMGNNLKIFPRAGAGLQYKINDKYSIRALGRYSDDWSYSFGVRRVF